eukprot:scaffold7482_cov151-Isochrysis_galbana.AAC.5
MALSRVRSQNLRAGEQYKDHPRQAPAVLAQHADDALRDSHSLVPRVSNAPFALGSGSIVPGPRTGAAAP